MRRMPLSTATLEAFCAGLPAALRDRTPRAALDAAVIAGMQQARAAWPALVDDGDAWLLRVAARLTDECELAGLAWADLALADACLRGLPAALAAFEAGHGHELLAALAAAGVDAAARDEALQRLRLRLLVREDGEPRLASYAGRGPLRTWLRVAALREALMLARASRRRAAHEVVDEDALLEHAAVAEDPELMLLQGRCREALRVAFAGAVAGLDSRERTLLRLALRDRLSIDQIGALYRVHRSTAARWLQAVRDRLAAATRAELATKFALADAEVESLIRAIGSRIDLSLGSIAPASPAT
jgi:RNA polymerase sigma-70 factor, ECF subfamily